MCLLLCIFSIGFGVVSCAIVTSGMCDASGIFDFVQFCVQLNSSIFSGVAKGSQFSSFGPFGSISSPESDSEISKLKLESNPVESRRTLKDRVKKLNKCLAYSLRPQLIPFGTGFIVSAEREMDDKPLKRGFHSHFPM